jgi:hypothetical protein
MTSTISQAIRKSSMSAKQAEFSEKRLMRAQDQVMTGYIKKFNLSEKDQEYLHMFFSPFRIPRNLTRGEVWLILLLQKEKGEAIRVIGRRPGYKTKMTRSGFLRMIDGLIHDMSRELPQTG